MKRTWEQEQGAAVVDSDIPLRGATAVRAGFWRRLAACWVDGFVLYAAASFLIGVAALGGVRLAVEPAFLALGMVCGVGCLHFYGGRTLGKLLLGLAVARPAGGEPGFARVCVREALGKWIILGALPGMIGRLVLKAGWVPTAYDLLAVVPLILATLGYYACCRRTWYDQMAGTAVLRRPATPPMTRSAFAIFVGVAVLGCGAKGVERISLGTLPSRTLLYHGMGSVEPHKDFLRQTAVSPNDYIFGLFERFDVVVLCERAHSEATQWDFIFDLVRDPRFSQRVGHVFTELGQVGMQSYLDEFMATDGLSDLEVNERVLHIMRHWAVWPRWHRVNFPTYLQRLYAFNQSLPSARRIRHHFTDVAVDWPNLTQEKMAAHWRSLGHRDEQMARVIIAEMERLDRAGGKRAKSLVIMNFRHAFDLTGGAGQAPRYNTCEFLRDALPGRVANVRINEDLFWPVAAGRWNAAFEQTGNRPTGFDLAGTPFGKEPFDLFPWNPSIRGRLKYQDVFTGFVFVNAARAQYFLEGVPGYYRGWEEEMRRRARLFGSDYVKMVDQEIVREKQGRVPVKSPHVVFSIASWVETALASLFAFGFIIGCASFGFRNRVNAPVPAPKAEPNRVSVGATLPSAASQRSPGLWFAFIAAIVASLFVHEVGHCAIAWLHGCPAIPTPAKEYLLKPLPQAAQNEVALGGILGSVAALVGALYWLYRKPGPLRSALVAGAMSMPGFYGLRFFLAGRGHDATEFQDAQAALGLSYSGHALDWLFIGLFTLAAAVWFWRVRPSIGFRLARRLLLGSVTALAVVVLLQVGNNALFDPLFQR